MDVIVVHTTLASREDAESLAQALVERQLAACVQIIGPIRSIYRWQEKLENSEEWLCQIKSRRSTYDRLQAAFKELHPYEVPEILMLTAEGVNQSYLQWLHACVPE